MMRLLHITLFIMAVLGVVGQSTAMAMAPWVPAPQRAGAMAMTGMDCVNSSAPGRSNKAPCKKLTVQCIAAMGCAALTFTKPPSQPSQIKRSEKLTSATAALAHLLVGREYGPEPDPPSLLI